MPKKAVPKRKRPGATQRRSKRVRTNKQTLDERAASTQETNERDDPSTQDEEHTTVLNIDTAQLQDSVTAKVVDAISEHIKSAVQKELSHIFPANQQASPGIPQSG